MSVNNKKTKPNKPKSPNSSLVSLKDLVNFAENTEKEADDSLLQNVKVINDKVANSTTDGLEDIVNQNSNDYVYKALNKLVEQRENSKYTNLRVRSEFRTLLMQIKLLQGFDDYNLGEIMEAFFNAFLNEHKDLIGKHTVVKKTI